MAVEVVGRELVLSASSMNAYLECPLRWYFSYVLAERGETTLKKVIGIACHDAIEILLKNLINHPADGPLPNAEDVYNAAFDTELSLGPVRMAKDDPGVEEGRASGLKALTLYMKVLAENPDDIFSIAHVELPFEIEVNGIPYSGSIDRVDADNDPGDALNKVAVMLRDTKITHQRPRKGKYRLNMIGYALGLEAETGLHPDMMVLDYIVRTKDPYYWPEYIDGPSPLDVADFANTLQQVAEGIDAARYPADGLHTPMACATCPHTRDCGPYQRLQEKLNP
jgi:RecB family exonuclease